MLRLVSVVGITLAMVIGFVALSMQMRDDYDVKTKVVNGIEDMIAFAQQELTCDKSKLDTNVEPPGTFEQDPAEQDNGGDSKEPLPDTAIGGDPMSIFDSMAYENVTANSLDVIAVFKDVTGGSGKLRIKSGRQLTIRCTCNGTNLSCQTVTSDVNKKYIPAKLTR